MYKKEDRFRDQRLIVHELSFPNEVTFIEQYYQLKPDTHSKDDNQWNNLIFYIKEGKHIVPIDFLVNFEILYHNIKTGQMLAHKM